MIRHGDHRPARPAQLREAVVDIGLLPIRHVDDHMAETEVVRQGERASGGKWMPLGDDALEVFGDQSGDVQIVRRVPSVKAQIDRATTDLIRDPVRAPAVKPYCRVR